MLLILAQRFHKITSRIISSLLMATVMDGAKAADGRLVAQARPRVL